jgi:hypothetical protein
LVAERAPRRVAVDERNRDRRARTWCVTPTGFDFAANTFGASSHKSHKGGTLNKGMVRFGLRSPALSLSASVVTAGMDDAAVRR